MPASSQAAGPAGAGVSRAEFDAPGREALDAWFEREGLHSSWWSNGPGDRYGWHAHPYAKVLFCQQGGIVFHLRDGEVTLHPGDRLELDPATDHAATVGPEGVVCVEAAR